MNSHNLNYGYPFSVIAGQGLGCPSNQDSIPFAHKAFGLANIHCQVNMATGNMMAHDRTISIPDLGGPIEFSYIYNSQAENSTSAWKMKVGRQVKLNKPTSLLNSFHSLFSSSQLNILEADGHEIPYILKGDGCYYSTEAEEGIPYIKLNNDNSGYSWHHPKLKTTELFDARGLLIKHIDASGNETSYKYTETGELNAVISASGARYEIHRKDQLVELFLIDKNNKTLLHTYEFENGKLKNSKTPDGYEIQYQYDDTSRKVKSITQSDGSVLQFGYYPDDSNRNKLKTIQAGNEDKNAHNFIYSEDKAILIDAAGIKTSFKFDNEKRIQDFIQSTNQADKDSITHFDYTSQGQIKRKKFSDQSEATFEYDEKSGLLLKHIDRDKTIVNYAYSSSTEMGSYPVVIKANYSKVDEDKRVTKELGATFYVYEKLTKNSIPLLRFKISSEGRVEEYRYTTEGLVESQYNYSDLYKPLNIAPTLADMEKWKKEKGRLDQNISTLFTYDERGRLKRKYHDREFDKKVSETPDGNSPEQLLEYDILGHCTELSVKQSKQDDPQKYLTSTFSYTSNGNLLRKTVGPNQITTHEYKSNQVITTHPNDRKETKEFDSRTLLRSEIDTIADDKQERKYHYEHDANGRLKTEQLPDGNKWISYYDKQNRPRFSISPEGAVTQIEHNDQFRYQRKTGYSIKVNIADIKSEADLEELWIGDEHHRDTYEFYNVNNKPRFTLDAENYLIEFQYDNWGNLSKKISYAEEISPEELESLKKGNDLVRKPSRKKDQIMSYFYDRDGHKIGEQNPLGYVTRFIRDGIGRLTKEIRYSTPCEKLADTIDEIVPSENPEKDAHHHYFYNSLNQCILEVDAEDYITTRAYRPDGQVETSIRYETPAANWTNKNIAPQPIASKHGNDEETNYVYDEQGRKKEIRTSNGKVTTYSYDKMNNLIEKKSEDANKSRETVTNGDNYRASEFKYNGWGETIAKADPLIKERQRELSHPAKNLDKKTESNIPWLRKTYNEVGLKIKSIDSLDHATLYYYTLDGKPALAIDATGAVIENKYNTFGDIEEERHYYNRIPSSTLLTLKGGYIEDEILNLITHDPSRDIITKYERDRRGQIIKKIDPEHNEYSFQYNAFKQCRREVLPKIGNNTLEVIHEYDSCNNIIKKETIATTIANVNQSNEMPPTIKKQTITVESKYEHFLGKETEFKNELGARTKTQFDKLGRAKKIDQEITKDQFLTEEEMQYNAFHRVVKKINAENKTTTIEYKQKERLSIVQSPIADTKTTLKENVFGQVIGKINGEGDAESIHHAADGQVTEHTIGTQTNRTRYNVIGLKEEEIDGASVKRTFTYNEANQLIKKIADADEKGLNLTEQFQPNAFGHNELEMDARKVETQNEFNRCGFLVKEIKDPSGKALTVNYVRNAHGDEIARITGDKTTPVQHHVATEYDPFNQVAAKVIDSNHSSRPALLPEPLEIRTEYQRDAIGNVVKEIDPNGNSTYHFRNLAQQKLFSVKPLDKSKYCLTAWSYTKTGKVAETRAFNAPIDAKSITDTTTLEEIKLIANPDDKNDSITRYFYDDNDRELFNVTVVWNASAKKYQSIVVEKQYDKADRVNKKIYYYNSLESTDFPHWQADDFRRLITRNEGNDQIHNYWYDTESRERFIIDQYGAVQERRYDKAGHLIAEIFYSKPFNDWKHKSLKELETEIAKQADFTRDSITYKVYDSIGREVFIVNPEGTAIRKDYDENHNLIQECRFKDPVLAKDYPSLVDILKKRILDNKKDTITKTTYDKLGFENSITDPLGYKDTYERNTLGHILTHTDRANHIWQFKYDRASRLTEEISPKTTIAIPTKTDQGKLSFVEAKTTITKKTDFDKAGNSTRIIEGILEKGTFEEKLISTRSFELTYNSQNKVTGTALLNSLVDDESKPGSLKTLPEKEDTLRTQTVWDTRGNKLVEFDESNFPIFNIYDNANRLILKIDREGYATQYKYNSFDQPTQVIYYATKLSNLNNYYKTGLTPDVAFEKLDIKHSSDDRIKETTYDRSGRLVGIKTGPVFYYSDGKAGLAQPETKKEFNTLGDCTIEYRLIRPEIWSKKFTWYDKCKRIIAEVDENNYLTRYENNTNGKVETRKEYNNPLVTIPTLSTTVQELDKQISESPSDRIYHYTYDLLGQITSETTVNVTTEELELDEKTSIPTLKVNEKQSLTRAWKYSPTQKEISQTHEDGSSEYKYYDERALKIAETEVSRTSLNAAGEKTIVTPLTLSKVNAFGQVVVTQTSFQGGTLPDEKGTVPELILKSSSNDTQEQLIQTISLHDNRGLVKLKQDPNSNVAGFTYTPSRKIARKIHEVSAFKRIGTPGVGSEVDVKSIPDVEQIPDVESTPDIKSTSDLKRTSEFKLSRDTQTSSDGKTIPEITINFEKVKHIDESKFKYDRRDRTIQTSKLRDNQVERENYRRFNAFDELTGECIDAKSWNSYKKMDTQGNPWFTEDQHGGTIRLCDLRGAETLRLQSTDMDLQTVNYSVEELSKLLAIDSKSLERTETTHDAGSRPITRKFPIWFKDKKPLPTRSYQYDHWNLVKETDSLANPTDYEYNHRDQIKSRILPEVTVVQTIGNKVIIDEEHKTFPRRRPVIRYGHNKRGFKVGVTDANNHTHGDILDEAGQAIKNVLADGTATKQIFNAKGLLTSVTDPRGQQWKYHYDLAGNLFLENWPIKNFDRSYEYDEVNRRILDRDAMGRSNRYNYDASSNITERFLPLGQCTQIVCDHNGLELSVTQPDGDTIRSKRDYFGTLLSHQDLEGRTTVYEHDFKKQPKRQFLASGAPWGSVEINKPIIYQPGDAKHDFPAVTFVPRIFSSKPQDITYNHAYGLIESIIDMGLGKTVTYQQDTEGRPTEIEVRAMNSEKTLLNRITTTLDEIGREKSIRDERLSDKMFNSTMEAMLLYDASSNRRNIDVTTTASGYSRNCKITKRRSYWNHIDDADRVLISNGSVNSDRCIVLLPNQGFKLDYSKGFRIRESRIHADGHNITADVNYNNNGLLSSTAACTPKPVITECSFSDAGHLDCYAEIFDGKKIVRTAHLNENAWPKDEVTTDTTYPSGAVSTLTTLESFQNGLPKVEQFHDAKSSTTDVRKNTYLRTDSSSLCIVRATRTTSSGTSPESSAQFLHDSNGILNGKIDSADETYGDSAAPVVCMDTLPQGWVMNKQCILYRGNRQTNYLHSINGELLGGYTSGYMDTLSSVPRAGIIRGFFKPDRAFAENVLEPLLKNPNFPEDGILLDAHGKGIMYFLNRKILRIPNGDPIYASFNISSEDFHALPFDSTPIAPLFYKANRDRCPWLFDKVMDLARGQIGASQAYDMQKNHFAFHAAGIGQDIKPQVEDFIPYSPVHPIARIYSTDPSAKNNPLDWDEPQLMSKLGMESYVVIPGDTFKSIAKKLGGDSQDALKIARCNGFPSHRHAPKPGLMLRVPQLITSKNNIKTSRPDHDFMRVVGGVLSPILRTPNSTRTISHVIRRKKRSFWGFLVKIIAITLVCIAAPHLAPHLAAFLLPAGIASSATAVAITTGVVAAIGDAAAQGLTMRLTGQPFSFAEMFETAVTAGVGCSLKPLDGSLTVLATNAMKIGKAAVAVQLTEMAAGEKFNPNAIITQIASYVLAAKINNGIDGLFGQRTALAYAARTVATPFSNALVGKVVTHTPMDVRSIAANAIGSTIGTELGERTVELMKPRPTSIPSIDIDVNDHKWSSDLSDLASRQRQARALQSEATTSSRSYLLDADRQAKYKSMLFGNSTPRTHASVTQTRNKLSPKEVKPNLSTATKAIRELTKRTFRYGVSQYVSDVRHNIDVAAHGSTMQSRVNAGLELAKESTEGLLFVTPALGEARIAGTISSIFGRSAANGAERFVQEKSFELNRFHAAAQALSEEGQQNIRTLRGWAKSKGWEKLPNPNGGPEKWMGLNRDGKLEVKLAIKPEGSMRTELDPISSQPRFEARLESGGKSYINPFTSQIGRKEIGGHVWLENPYLSYQQQIEFIEFGRSYTTLRRGF